MTGTKYDRDTNAVFFTEKYKEVQRFGADVGLKCTGIVLIKCLDEHLLFESNTIPIPPSVSQ